MKYVWHHWEKKSLIVSTIWWKLCKLFVFLKKSWQIEYFIAKKELGSCHESKWASQDASNLDLKGNSGRWDCNENQWNILTAAEFSHPPLRLKTILIEAYNEMQVQNWKRSKSRNLPKFSISRHLLISKKVSRLESIVFERKYGNWFLNHQNGCSFVAISLICWHIFRLRFLALHRSRNRIPDCCCCWTQLLLILSPSLSSISPSLSSSSSSLSTS